MKLSIRLTAFALTAVAITGALGAQQRGSNSHSSPRAQAPRSGQAQSRGPSAPRGQQAAPRAQAAPRGYAAPRGGQMASRSPQRAPQDYHGQQYAPARPDNRGDRGNYGARNDAPGRNGYQTPRGNAGRDGYQPGRAEGGRGGYQAPRGFDGRNGYRVPVADHGRPLITRANAGNRGYGREGYQSRFIGGRQYFFRTNLPYGWDNRIVFNGYFPMAYGSYCDAVPEEYDYLLPPMLPSYDPCLFGDRVVVYDRFSRSIVFVATL